MSTKTDVVICGSGSAGICAAVWLAQAGVPFRMLERRAGPLQLGQADGVQCRTVEIFESFGLAEDLLREANQVTELTFWSVDKKKNQKKLVRTNRAPDTPRGLSHQPHVLLNQARVNQLMIDKMTSYAPEQKIDYGYTVTGVEKSLSADDGYPVLVRADHEGREHIFQAKYVLVCDGAHSSVRHSLSIDMLGDTSDTVWGVMDVYPRTDFPDIRRKTTIHGDDLGILLLIPREDQMVRFYLKMPAGTDPKQVTLKLLHERAKSVLRGFSVDFAETVWWSAYTIGQRLASQFSALDGRVLLAGDACHTHSPKAGQGMNVSLQDGFDLGWKLASILCGRVDPRILSTYVLERQKVAEDLIRFDRKLNELLQDGNTFHDHFLESARFMAGLAARYDDSALTSAGQSDQTLARNIIVGMRFPSASMVRYCDAQAVQFATEALKADNYWRVIVFSGDLQIPACAERLEQCPYIGQTADGKPPIVEPVLVIAKNRTLLELDQIPKVFLPENGKYGIRNLYNIYVDDENYKGYHGHAYKAFGIDDNKGAVVVVRPDQYVSLVTSLDQVGLVDKFFGGFLRGI